MEEKNKNIVAIVPAISQPRVIKRLNSLSDAGYKIKVYGYSRGMNVSASYNSKISVEVISNIGKGRNYIKRFFQEYRQVKEIIKKEGNNSLYYSFEFVFSLCLWANRMNFLYEISDVMYAYKKFALLSPLFKFLDTRIIRKSVMTIMTSQGFLSYYFGDKHPKNVLIQQNKLSRKCLDFKRVVAIPENVNSLRFAFVGFIRYPKTTLRFAKVIGEHFPQHRFTFYGDSFALGEFINEMKQYSNVFFKGAFKNPDDLGEIYSDVDILMSCYETKELNIRIAEPNKLFEAMYFCKPIIVSKGTFLEQQVKKYGCGFAINAYSEDDIKSFINHLTVGEIQSIVERESLLETNDLIDNPNTIINGINGMVN